MALIEINWRPSHKELRDFGKIALVAALVVFLFLYLLKGLAFHWAAIPLAVSLVIFLVSLISDQITRLIYLGLVLLTLPIGWIISLVLLVVFYFLIITPIGLIFRLMGRDPLCRRFEPKMKSYWLRRRRTDSLERYFRQF